MIIVEGKKDVDTLVEIGFTTTICPIGAKKWRDEYNETLKGKHIVLIPDNDNEGRGHMAQVYYKIGTLKAFAITSSPLFKRPGDIPVLQ